MFEPYIVPSEYGGRQDTRWVSVTSHLSNNKWPSNYGILLQALEHNRESHRLVRSIEFLQTI